MNLPILVIVSPCYNEEELAQNSCEILLNLLNKLVDDKIISEQSYISVVDDGSTDKSWEILNKLANKDKRIKLIKFVHNFGHQNAILAGMTENNADIYITLDFDLQDDINIIPEMIEKYKNCNIDIVYGVRNNREVDSFMKKFFAKLYYMLCKMIGLKQIYECADFRLVTNNVVKVLRNTHKNNIYLRGLLPSLELSYEKVYYKRKERLAGIPKYTFLKSFELAMNGLLSSNKAFRLINIPAAIFLIISIFIWNKILFGISIILFAIALLGEYATKRAMEAKPVTHYIISEKINYE